MNAFLKLWNDESGASAAEYALILAVVGGGIAAGALALGQAINTELGQATALVGGAIS